MVIDTLKDLDPERKCFRLVGGVLVERTVKEVAPALRSSSEGVCVGRPRLIFVYIWITKIRNAVRMMAFYRKRIIAGGVF